MLDLQFNAEQEMLRETVRGVCATTSPLSVVRELEDDATGYAPDLWKQLAHLDLIGLQLPEEFGGSGMTTLEGVVLYEELGRSLAPSPHFVSAVLCGGALARAGDDEQKQSWLPRIVSGEAILTPAWLEPDGGTDLGIQVQAQPTRTDSSFPVSNGMWPSLRRPLAWWCWPGPAMRPATSTSSSWIRPHRGWPSPSSRPLHPTVSTAWTSTGSGSPLPTVSADRTAAGPPGTR